MNRRIALSQASGHAGSVELLSHSEGRSLRN